MVMTHTTVGAAEQRGTAATMAPSTPTEPTGTADRPDLLPEGAKVEVRSTLDQRWSGGFVVVTASAAGYRLRRSSDDAELPTIVPVDQVRRERKRNTWWM